VQSEKSNANTELADCDLLALLCMQSGGSSGGNPAATSAQSGATPNSVVGV